MFEDYLALLKKYKSVVVLGAILVMAIGAFLVLQQKPEAKTTDFPTVTTTTASQESTEETSSESPERETILVDVKGAVQSEGVYELPSTARVNDAIEAAGGFSDQADKKSVNLAQKLSDEAVVYVASQGENVSVVQPATSSPTAGNTGSENTEKINLNTATVADLTTISGIGEKRANDILAYRDSQGGFTSVDDLNNVSGIGDKTLENIRPYVTVD
jgi:competence protein ComEA